MRSPEDEVLFVYQSAADCQGGDDPEHVLVIDALHSEVADDRADDLFETVVSLDVPRVAGVPVYQILSRQIWWNLKGVFGEGSYTMIMLLAVYEHLTAYIETEGIERVECRNLREEYQPLMADLREEYDITVFHQTQTNDGAGWQDADLTGRSSQALVDAATTALVSTILIQGDQIVSLLLGPFFKAADSELAILFPAGRPRTLRTIYKKLDVNSDLLTSLKTTSFLLRHHSVFPEARTGVRPMNTFVSLRVFCRELRFLWRLFTDIWWRGQTVDAVVDCLEDEFGHRLPRTVMYLVRMAVAANIESILLYIIYEDALGRCSHKRLFVPNVASRSKALIYAASRHDVPTYELPHNVMNQYDAYRQFAHTIFASGDIDCRHLAPNDRIETVVTGYPKHQFIRKRYEEFVMTSTDDSDKPPRTGKLDGAVVLVATQPYPDRIRTQFAEDVLHTLLTNTNYEVIVKTHPGEDADFYRDLLEERGLLAEYGASLTIDESNLYEHIHRCSLVVTIASNVALEAVIMNTPAVSYNRWSPDVRTPLYATYGSVPELNTLAELVEFLEDLDIDGCREEQTAMLSQEYRVLDTDLETIAEEIRDELTAGLVTSGQ